MSSGSVTDRWRHAQRRASSVCCLLAVALFAVLASTLPAEDPPAAEPAEQAEKPPETPPRAGNNVLPDLLQGILGGRKFRGNDRPAPRQRAEVETDESGNRDPADSRAARDARNENVLRTAEQAMQRSDYKTAIDFLQRLLDEPGDSLHRVSRERWQSLRQTAQDALARLPSEGQALYREQYEGLARKEWDAARSRGDAEVVARIADRFLHTPAGQEAADWLANLHTDRGEFGLADRWNQELLRTGAPVTRTAAWQWKAAFVARQAGRSPQDAPWPAELPPGPAGARFNGLKDLSLAARLSTAPLNDWQQAYGSERRQGTSAAGDPLLIPRWENPLTDSPAVARRIEQLQLDLRDQGLAPILAWQPIGAHGLVLYRGLRGVRAVEIATGDTLWETETSMTPERMIAGLPPDGVDPQQAWRFRMNNLQQDSEYAGPSAEYHPVASLLYRDGVYGSLSTDGRHVFLLEDHAVLPRSQPGWQWGEQENQDLYGLDWTSNRLSAYDLASGRLRWTVGGSADDESLQLPLSDVCFLGAPVVDGDELFVIGARGDEVRLWCLETLSGRFLWSQLLCYQDAKIDKDIGRRWLTVQPSLADGLVVCPTALGWLVAVDRLRHSVLWATRYAEPSTAESRENGGNLVPQRSIDSTWGPSAPVIAGRSIVYTAPEEPLLLCVDLLTGDIAWQQAQEDLYLAGVFDERILLIGGHQVRALSVSNGSQLWHQPLDLEGGATGDEARQERNDVQLDSDPAHADDGPRSWSAGPAPAGRGLAVPGEYYLPLTTGELRVIRLEDGAVSRRFFTGQQTGPLGNLVWHNGLLVSLSTAGATGFGLRSSVLAEVQQRLARDPRDAWALMREGEVLAMSRKFAEAWQQLKAVPLPDLSPADQQRWHRVGRDVLEQLIRQDPQRAEPWLTELRRLAATPADRSLLADLEVTRLAALGNAVEAFERAWREAEGVESPDARARLENRKVEVQPGAWHRGRLQDLWQSSTDAGRTGIDEFVAGLLKALPGRDAVRQNAVRQLLSFHPAAADVALQHAAELAQQGELARAEIELLALIDLAPRAAAGRSLLELVRLAVTAGRIEDAQQFALRLEERFPEETLPDGRKLAAAAADLLPPSTGQPLPPRAQHATLKLQQGMIDSLTPEQEVPTDGAAPALRKLDLVIQPGERRLVVSDRQTGERLWLAPLRSGPQEHGDGQIPTALCGNTLFLVHQGVLHAIAPLERRILWTEPVSAESADGGHWRTAEREPPMPLVRPEELQGYGSPVLSRGMRSGALAAVNPHYVAVASRRTMRVLHPSTGEELWQYHGLSPEDVILPLASRLIVMDLDGEVSAVLRACDGKPLDLDDDDIRDLLGRAMAVQGDAVLVSKTRQKSGLFSFLPGVSRTSLALRDAVTGAERWSSSFDGPGLLGLLSPDEVAFVQSSGRVQLIDVSSGAARQFEAGAKFPLSDVAEMHLLADERRLFLLVNGENGRRFDHYSESVPSIEMHGTIVCWDRVSGTRLWKRDVKKQHLVVEHFRSSPVLLFVARNWVNRENLNYTLLNLLALDKATGEVRYESSLPTMINGFHSLKVLPLSRGVELRSYNYRIRLVADGPVEGAAVAPRQP